MLFLILTDLSASIRLPSCAPVPDVTGRQAGRALLRCCTLLIGLTVPGWCLNLCLRCLVHHSPFEE